MWYRFRKGSGLPVRIPVIEMVEIGAGGGSIASVDRLGRIQVGPKSAGSEPGPACYGRGGEAATVTDADMVLGRLDASRFAGGSMVLDAGAARAALEREVDRPWRNAAQSDAMQAAEAVSEIVDENMAAAARAHAAEWGKDMDGRTLIAFGGAAPLHAAQLAEKLGLACVVVPPAAGVGSAIGFLAAPIAFEVVRSRHMLLSAFDTAAVSATWAEMRAEAEAVVGPIATGDLVETRSAYMRYLGQGYEIAVAAPEELAVATLRRAFDAAYTSLYGRLIPGLDVEVLSWTLTLRCPALTSTPTHANDAHQRDPRYIQGERRVARETLVGGDRVGGPAVIVEDQTAIVVPGSCDAYIDSHGNVVLRQRT